MSLAVLKTRCSLLQHSSTSWNRSTSSTPPSTSGEYGYLSDELCLCLFYCPHQDYLPWKLGVIFFPPFGTDIWGSTTSVTFDASGHLSDQWVWPSVWSLRVASCFVLGTLRPLMNTLLPYVTKSFLNPCLIIFQWLGGFTCTTSALPFCLSIECVDLFMAFQAQRSLWHNQRLPPGPPP